MKYNIIDDKFTSEGVLEIIPTSKKEADSFVKLYKDLNASFGERYTLSPLSVILSRVEVGKTCLSFVINKEEDKSTI